MGSLLLDTCAVLWIAEGSEISAEARDLIKQRDLKISAISAWEVANLVRKNRVSLSMRPAAWFREAANRMGAALSDLGVDLLVDSCALPGEPPNDPADRIIIATARENDMTIVTRDRLILDYARAGHVRAVVC
jgi:PIN domain nuclease of toxin-antitoxin system